MTDFRRALDDDDEPLRLPDGEPLCARLERLARELGHVCIHTDTESQGGCRFDPPAGCPCRCVKCRERRA